MWETGYIVVIALAAVALVLTALPIIRGGVR